MSALETDDAACIVDTIDPGEARVEPKKHRKSLQLRRLAQSFDKNSTPHSATSVPITPLALHREMGIVSPRSLENETDAATASSLGAVVGGGKLLLAVSWPGIGGVAKSIVVSPRAREMSPRELNRKLTAALVDKNLKGTVTTITRDLADLVNDDEEIGEQQQQQAADIVAATRTTPPDLPLEIPNGLVVSRARSTLAHRSMPVFNRATVATALASQATAPIDTRKFTFDKRVHNDMRRVSSSSTTATTSSSSSVDDGSSTTTSADKRNTFVLDRSAEDESSSTLANNGTTAAAESEEGVRRASSSNGVDNQGKPTLPRRKSERFFAEFKQIAIPTVSPHSPPRARPNAILNNNGLRVRVNSYSHSVDRSPRSAREAVTRIIKGNRDISREKTLIQLFVDPVGDRLVAYLVPNVLIDGKLRNTLTCAATSNVESQFRSFACTAACVKTEGPCSVHLVDPDAAAKYPIINLLDRKRVPVDYRLPHLQVMFLKEFPMLLGDEWSRFKREGLCTDFSAERISNVYCIRVYC